MYMEMSLSQGVKQQAGEPPLIRTVQQAARVFFCVVYHKLGLLAGLLPLGADAEGEPYRHVARRRSFAVQVWVGEGGLISANQMEIETDRPPDFSL